MLATHAPVEEFAAEQYQMAMARQPTPVEEYQAMAPVTSNQGQEERGSGIDKTKYKTRLCRNWSNGGGTCQYGDRCAFAHGEQEKRRADTAMAMAVAAAGAQPLVRRTSSMRGQPRVQQQVVAVDQQQQQQQQAVLGGYEAAQIGNGSDGTMYFYNQQQSFDGQDQFVADMQYVDNTAAYIAEPALSEVDQYSGSAGLTPLSRTLSIASSSTTPHLLLSGGSQQLDLSSSSERTPSPTSEPATYFRYEPYCGDHVAQVIVPSPEPSHPGLSEPASDEDEEVVVATAVRPLDFDASEE